MKMTSFIMDDPITLVLISSALQSCLDSLKMNSAFLKSVLNKLSLCKRLRLIRATLKTLFNLLMAPRTNRTKNSKPRVAPTV